MEFGRRDEGTRSGKGGALLTKPLLTKALAIWGLRAQLLLHLHTQVGSLPRRQLCPCALVGYPAKRLARKWEPAPRQKSESGCCLPSQAGYFRWCQASY